MEAEYTAALRKIEEADEAIAAAVEKRARASLEAAAIRAKDPERFFARQREADVVTTFLERVPSLKERGARAVVREVISACEALVAPRTIVYLGGEGSFGHYAGRERFGASAVYESVSSADDALGRLMREQAAFAVLPLETSSDGAVTATLHGLAKSEAQLCGEIGVPATYSLWVEDAESASMEKVARVYGTRLALAACEDYLARNLGEATLIDVPTAADAVKLVAGDGEAAAIGSALLGTKLQSLASAIEDEPVSLRFAVVGHQLPSRTGADRTLVSMAMSDDPGALYSCLKPLADRGINLTRVESRPAAGGPWRYLFFVEMDGHVTDRSLLTGL
ncbi:MAG: prephenate dehydratase domain-containing protein, partial [Myxococcota bacterium]